MRIVLDTDVASVSIRQQLPPALLRRISGYEPAITFVTIGELEKWVHLRDLGQRRRREIEMFIAALPRIPGGQDVARTWVCPQ